MNLEASRNKFRGLTKHIEAEYAIEPSTDPKSVYEALNANGWAGVPLASVMTAVRTLKLRQGKATARPRASTPNILLTLPLPKKQSVTLQYLEARELYRLLAEIFGPAK